MSDKEFPAIVTRRGAPYAGSTMNVDWTTWEPKERATLLFVIKEGQILLIRKKRGLGAGKINGPGGRLEPGETRRRPLYARPSRNCASPRSFRNGGAGCISSSSTVTASPAASLYPRTTMASPWKPRRLCRSGLPSTRFPITKCGRMTPIGSRGDRWRGIRGTLRFRRGNHALPRRSVAEKSRPLKNSRISLAC